MNNIEQQVRSIIADALEVSSVPADASMETLDAWDSVKQLTIVMSIEDAFGIQLEPEEVAALSSIQAIVARVKEGASPA